jgi:hypothetical protein
MWISSPAANIFQLDMDLISSSKDCSMAKSGKQTQPDGLKEEGEGIPGGRKERH